MDTRSSSDNEKKYVCTSEKSSQLVPRTFVVFDCLAKKTETFYVPFGIVRCKTIHTYGSQFAAKGGNVGVRKLLSRTPTAIGTNEGEMMIQPGKILVRCSIERGGFGNERTYKVKTAGGGVYTGIAPWFYCFTNTNEQVEYKSTFEQVAEEPALDQSISGYIVGRLIRNGGDDAKVAFPDGEVCLIKSEHISRLPESVNETINRVLV